MKNIKNGLLVAALSLLVSTNIQFDNNSKELVVGDIDEFGGTILRTDVSENELFKFSPMVIPSDTYYNTQLTYSLSNVGNIEKTWDYYKGEGTMVAIIDSGIVHNHEDFVDEHGNSKLSDLSAYFYTSSSYPYSVSYKLATSDNWECMKHEYDDYYEEWDTHGSNVAGCSAASMNGVGTVGIAPDAEILMLKIDFYMSSIDSAIRYAVDNGADVINMSLGAYDSNDPHTSDDSYDDVADELESAISYAIDNGVIVVAAAGNESTNAKSYPACNTGVIGVGALAKNSNTTAASFSNYNKSSDTVNSDHNVDVMAPGYVWAPGLDGEQLVTNSSSNYPDAGYGATQGTSFASPIVAGAACLWKEKNPSGTPAEFEAQLYESAVDMGNFAKYGNGRLDVYELLDIDNEGLYLSDKSLTLTTNSSDTTITAYSESNVTNWSNSNNNVITISGETGNLECNATVHVVGAGTSTITATNSNGDIATCTVTVEQYVEVTGIATTAISGTEVMVSKSFNLGAYVLPTNAHEQSLTYVSNDPSIATVDASGKVTGVLEGETYITITATNGVSITFNVVVTALTVEEYEITFADNGTDANSDITASELYNYLTTGNDVVSSFSGINKIYKGVYGLKLSSKSTNGSFTINLSSPIKITEIIVNAKYYSNKQNAKIMINDMTTNDFTDNFSDYTLTYDGSLVNSLQVFGINRSYLKGLTIIAGIEANKDVTGVSLSDSSISVYKGMSYQLSATVLPSDATNQNVTWSSSNSSVATVSSAGLVTALTVGTTTITVRTEDGGYTASCTVEVLEFNDILSVQETSVMLEIGGTSQIILSSIPTGYSQEDIVFTSLNNDIATVSNSGLITAVSIGTTTVKVATNDDQYSTNISVRIKNDTGEEVIPDSDTKSNAPTIYIIAGIAAAVITIVGIIIIAVVRKAKK